MANTIDLLISLTREEWKMLKSCVHSKISGIRRGRFDDAFDTPEEKEADLVEHKELRSKLHAQTVSLGLPEEDPDGV